MSAGCDTTTFTVTLVWNDIPGTVGCAHCLINDLDLYVIKNDITYYPNGNDSKDFINNSERIRLQDIHHGDRIFINVDAYTVISDQSYALVATGCFIGGVTRPSTSVSTNVFDGNYDDIEDEKSQSSNQLIIGISVSFAFVLLLCLVAYYFRRKHKYRTLGDHYDF